MPVFTKDLDSAFQTAGAKPYPDDCFYFKFRCSLCLLSSLVIVWFCFTSKQSGIVLTSNDKIT